MKDRVPENEAKISSHPSFQEEKSIEKDYLRLLNFTIEKWAKDEDVINAEDRYTKFFFAHKNLLSFIIGKLIKNGEEKNAYILLKVINDKVNHYPSGTFRSFLGDAAEALIKAHYNTEVYILLDHVKKEYPASFPFMLGTIAYVKSEHEKTMIDPETRSVILKVLTTLQDQGLRNELVQNLKRFFVETEGLVQQADENKQVMEEQKISYNQLLFMKEQKINCNQLRGWMDPIMPIILLQGISLNHRKLPIRMVYHIATCLSSMDFSQVSGLSTKLGIQLQRVRLFPAILEEKKEMSSERNQPNQKKEPITSFFKFAS